MIILYQFVLSYSRVTGQRTWWKLQPWLVHLFVTKCSFICACACLHVHFWCTLLVIAILCCVGRYVVLLQSTILCVRYKNVIIDPIKLSEHLVVLGELVYRLEEVSLSQFALTPQILLKHIFRTIVDYCPSGEILMFYPLTQNGHLSDGEC